MRKVRIPADAAPPEAWLTEARAVSAQLEAATEGDRDSIIEKNEKLWRDGRLRAWLLSLFHNKCWYTEAQESVSSYHVDHYRPKGRVADLEKNERPGYWWLAFKWDNYRICGQLINVKKRDVFPLREPRFATYEDPDSIKFEAPELIDPVTDDARLLSFEMDEETCIAVPSGGLDAREERRATVTIDVLGLNRLDLLNQKRADTWRKCRDQIAEYSSAAGEPHALRTLREGIAVLALKKALRYEEEFSSVAQACIWKSATGSLQAKVLLDP